MATPLVSGVVSSYWSRHPEQSALQVKSRLMDTVRPLDFSINTVTGGLMDMDAFINGNDSLSPMFTDYRASSLADVDYKHLSNSQKVDLIDETNAQDYRFFLT